MVQFLSLRAKLCGAFYLKNHTEEYSDDKKWARKHVKKQTAPALFQNTAS